MRSVTEREAEWDDESYELAAALLSHEADIHTCGHPLSESSSFDANPDNRDGKYRYEADDPVRCFACDAANAKQSQPEYSGDNFSPARVWRTRRVER